LAFVAALATGCAVPRLAIRKETADRKITPAEDISSLLDDE